MEGLMWSGRPLIKGQAASSGHRSPAQRCSCWEPRQSQPAANPLAPGEADDKETPLSSEAFRQPEALARNTGHSGLGCRSGNRPGYSRGGAASCAPAAPPRCRPWVSSWGGSCSLPAITSTEEAAPERGGQKAPPHGSPAPPGAGSGLLLGWPAAPGRPARARCYPVAAGPSSPAGPRDGVWRGALEAVGRAWRRGAAVGARDLRLSACPPRPRDHATVLGPGGRARCAPGGGEDAGPARGGGLGTWAL